MTSQLQSEECLQFRGNQGTLGRFEVTEMSDEARTVNGRQFMKAQRRDYFN